MEDNNATEGKHGREKTYKTCGAKNRKGLPCNKPPSRGRTRCRMHGGNAKLGIAHYNFRNGKYSNYLPTGLLDKYERSMLDPMAKTHGPELNLLDAKILDLLEKNQESDIEPAYREIQKLWDVFRKANSDKNTNLLESTAIRIHEILSGDITPTSRWTEIYECLELRRRMLDSEQRRLKDQQQMISIEELLILVRYIGDSIKTAITKHIDTESGRLVISDVTRDLTICLSRYAGPGSGHLQVSTGETGKA